MKYLYANGCSIAAGTELESENRFTSLVSKKLELEEINEALANGSNDRIFRKTFSWIANNQDKIDETIFLIQWTHHGRLEVYQGEAELYHSSWDKLNISDFYDYALELKGKTIYYYNEGKIYNSRTNSWYKAIDSPRELMRVSSDKTIRYIASLQNYFTHNNLKYIMFNGFDTNNITKDTSFSDSSNEMRELIDQDNFLYFGEYENFWNWSKKFYGLMPESHPNEDANKAFSNRLIKIIKNNEV